LDVIVLSEHLMRFCSRFLRLVALVGAGVALAASVSAQTPPGQTPPAQKPPPAAPKRPAQATPAPAQKDPIVATINGQSIRLSEVVAMQQELPPQYRKMPVEAVFPALLDRLVNAKLVVQEGKKNKVQNDPAYKKRLAFVEEQVLQEFWIQREIARRVTPEKLKERYDERIKAMPPEDEVKARHILVATEDEAKALLAELKKGGAFDKLAREKSTDKASGAEGGDLGWFKKTDMVPEFANAAFDLKKGGLTEAPVKTQFGFHIIQVDDRRTAPPPPFEDMVEQLREEATRETVTTVLNTLRANAKIEKFNIDGSKVETPPTPSAPTPPAPTPPATPARPPTR
jgi:peptidyl-prolyl cis-trans isomerase C